MNQHKAAARQQLPDCCHIHPRHLGQSNIAMMFPSRVGGWVGGWVQLKCRKGFQPLPVPPNPSTGAHSSKDCLTSNTQKQGPVLLQKGLGVRWPYRRSDLSSSHSGTWRRRCLKKDMPYLSPCRFDPHPRNMIKYQGFSYS